MRSLRALRGSTRVAAVVLALCAAWPALASGQSGAPGGSAAELSDVRRSIEELSREIRTRDQTKKDVWDKLSAVAGLASGLLVAIIGGIAAYMYNERQRMTQQAQNERELQFQEFQTDRELKVQQAQTVQSYLPNLGSTDPREKEAALLAISAIGNSELAVRLADMYADEASISALERIASGSDPTAAAAAERSLSSVLTSLRSSVVGISHADERPHQRGFVVDPDGLVVTADHVIRPMAATSNAPDEDKFTVHTADGVRHDADLVAVRSEMGVALLRIHGGNTPPLSLQERVVEIEALGELAYVEFTPEAWLTRRGRVEGVLHWKRFSGELWLTTLRTDHPRMQAGSPVVNRSGKVEGLIYASQQTPGGGAQLIVLPGQTLRRGVADL
jgi:hypothetical protein